MNCVDLRDRVVPWEDGELGPSEALLVERHLDGCASCRAFADRLASTRPAPPPLAVPADVLARLARATDVDLLAARAREPEHRAMPRLFPGRRLNVPLGALLLLLLAAGSVGWGLSAWWRPDRAAPSLAGAEGGTIPVEQFDEAAYEPPATPNGDPAEP